MAKTVGNFTLTNTIGNGIEGQVFEGINKSSGNQIVAKQLPLNNSNKLKVKNEHNILSLIKSKFLIELLDILTSENHIYLIYPKCMGCLSDYQGRGNSITEDLVRKWAYQILRGIQDMHMHQVMHRDIKLSNVVLDENLDAVIIDFGTSVFCPEGTASEYYGTEEYMAPEVKSKAEYSFKVDIYSYGILVQKLLENLEPSETAKHFAAISVDPDENQRASALELMNHDFIRAFLDDAIENMATEIQVIESEILDRESVAIQILFKRSGSLYNSHTTKGVEYIKRELCISMECINLAHHFHEKFDFVFHLVKFIRKKIEILCETVHKFSEFYSEDDILKTKSLQELIQNVEAPKVPKNSYKAALGVLKEIEKYISYSSINTFHLQSYVLAAYEISENSEISKKKKEKVAKKKDHLLELLRIRYLIK